MGRYEFHEYDWREHQCSERDCIVEWLLAAALFGSFFLVSVLS